MLQVAVWAGAVATILTSLGIVWNKLIKPVVSWGMRLDKAVSFVEQQMVPNGGSSLRDSLNRIEQRLTNVEDYVTRIR